MTGNCRVCCHVVVQADETFSPVVLELGWRLGGRHWWLRQPGGGTAALVVEEDEGNTAGALTQGFRSTSAEPL